MLEFLSGIIFTFLFSFSIFYFFYKLVKKFINEEKTNIKILSAICFEMFFLYLLGLIILELKIFIFLAIFLISMPFIFFLFKDLKRILKINEGFEIKKDPFFFILIVYILFYILEALITPPLSFDSLNYHMLIIGEIIQKGYFTGIPYSPALNQFGYYPKGFEIISSFFLLPTKSDFFSNLLNLPFFIIFILSLIVLFNCLKINNFRFKTGIFLIIFVPAFFSYLPTQYADFSFLSILFSGFTFFFLYYFKEKSFFAFLSFLNFSFSISFKKIGVFSFFAFLPFLIFIMIKRKQLNLKKVFTFFFIFLICSFNYLKNYFSFKNPFYPFPLKVFGEKIKNGDEVLEHYIRFTKEKKEEYERINKIEGLKKFFLPVFFIFKKIYSLNHEALGNTSLLFSFIGILNLLFFKEKFLKFFSLFQIFSIYLQFFNPDFLSFSLFYSLSYSRFFVYPNAILLTFSLIFLKENKFYDLLILLGGISNLFLTIPLNWFPIHTIIFAISLFLTFFLFYFIKKINAKNIIYFLFFFLIFSPFIEKKKEDLRFFFWENHEHIKPVSRITFEVAKRFWRSRENILIHFPVNFERQQAPYIYPFMGYKFSNFIFPINEKKQNKNFEEWLNYLKKNKIKYLIFSFPLNFEEIKWIEKNPKIFNLVFLNKYFCIFKFN